MSLLSSAFEEFATRDSFGEAEIVLDVWLPAREGLTVVNDNGIPQSSSEIDGRGEARDAAAHNNDIVTGHGWLRRIWALALSARPVVWKWERAVSDALPSAEAEFSS